MSKKPWPDRLKTITRASPVLPRGNGLVDRRPDGVRRLRRRDEALGPGELDRRLEARVLGVGPRLEEAQLVQVADQRRHAVVAQPAGVDRGRPELVAKGVHLDHAGPCRPCRRSRSGTRPGSGSGRTPARPPGSGSASDPSSRSRSSGKAMPAKFEPPPAQPITTSAVSPAISSCLAASCPITVWCSRTWFSTLPSEYLVSSLVAATSSASLMAMPSEPVESGSSARMVRPAFVSSTATA